MTTVRPLRVAAVLDTTSPVAEQRARALGAFLRDGLRVGGDHAIEAIAHVFHAGDGAGALALAPVKGVRLIHMPPCRPDLVTAALAAVDAERVADLYVFPGGPLGDEVAARLAARSGGSVLTGVQEVTLTGEALTCRRAAYANHLMASLDLGARPWCIALDATWTDAALDLPAKHVIHEELEIPHDDVPAPLHDVEHLEPPATGDLESARFLVVAGRGAGSRGGVERIAAAAARMGAAFGVTRPVVMNAWAGPDRQVGVSGTRTAPVVCIVAGASGAPAFLWGVERAGFIAAVDTDDRAPVTAEADAVVIDEAVAFLEALADVVGRSPLPKQRGQSD